MFLRPLVHSGSNSPSSQKSTQTFTYDQLEGLLGIKSTDSYPENKELGLKIVLACIKYMFYKRMDNDTKLKACENNLNDLVNKLQRDGSYYITKDSIIKLTTYYSEDGLFLIPKLTENFKAVLLKVDKNNLLQMLYYNEEPEYNMQVLEFLKDCGITVNLTVEEYKIDHYQKILEFLKDCGITVNLTVEEYEIDQHQKVLPFKEAGFKDLKDNGIVKLDGVIISSSTVENIMKHNNIMLIKGVTVINGKYMGNENQRETISNDTINLLKILGITEFVNICISSENLNTLSYLKFTNCRFVGEGKQLTNIILNNLVKQGVKSFENITLGVEQLEYLESGNKNYHQDISFSNCHFCGRNLTSLIDNAIFNYLYTSGFTKFKKICLTTIPEDKVFSACNFEDCGFYGGPKRHKQDKNLKKIGTNEFIKLCNAGIKHFERVDLTDIPAEYLNKATLSNCELPETFIPVAKNYVVNHLHVASTNAQNGYVVVYPRKMNESHFMHLPTNGPASQSIIKVENKIIFKLENQSIIKLENHELITRPVIVFGECYFKDVKYQGNEFSLSLVHLCIDNFPFVLYPDSSKITEAGAIRIIVRKFCEREDEPLTKDPNDHQIYLFFTDNIKEDKIPGYVIEELRRQAFKMFNILKENPNKPLIINCAHGISRSTGVFIAYIITKGIHPKYVITDSGIRPNFILINILLELWNELNPDNKCNLINKELELGFNAILTDTAMGLTGEYIDYYLNNTDARLDIIRRYKCELTTPI